MTCGLDLIEKTIADIARRNADLARFQGAHLIDLEPRYLVQMAHLTAPAPIWKYVQGAVTKTAANMVILDLDDSVPADDPEALRSGRENIVRAFNELDWGGKLRFFRPRGLQQDPGLHDTEFVIRHAGKNLDGLIYPKVEGPEEIGHLDEFLACVEEDGGLEKGSIKIGVMIESVLAEERAFEIARTSQRLVCLIFGAFDYWASLGLFHLDFRPDHPLISHARCRIVKAASHVGVPAIAEMSLNYPTKDKSPDQRRAALDECRRDAELAVDYGFMGKWTGIPAQVDIALDVFGISAEKIDKAVREIGEFLKAKERGRGATIIDGKLADAATDRMNRMILKAAYALGRLDAELAVGLGIA